MESTESIQSTQLERLEALNTIRIALAKTLRENPTVAQYAAEIINATEWSIDQAREETDPDLFEEHKYFNAAEDVARIRKDIEEIRKKIALYEGIPDFQGIVASYNESIALLEQVIARISGGLDL